MLRQRALPGFAAPWIRITITTTEQGYHDMAVMRAQGPGFAHKDDEEVYHDLTWEEALDVLSCVLDL